MYSTPDDKEEPMLPAPPPPHATTLPSSFSAAKPWAPPKISCTQHAALAATELKSLEPP